MMLDDDYDARVSGWLRDGADDVPRSVVTAAVAYAQAHPRHGRSVRGTLPVPGWVKSDAGLVRDTRRGLALAFGVVAAATAVTVVLMSGTSVLSPIRAPSSPQVPAVAPQTSSRPAPATSSPGNVIPRSDLAGTWSGTVVEAAPVDPTTDYQRDPSKDTTWSMTLDLHSCGTGGSCGTLAKTTKDLGGTGQALDCSATLSYGGRSQDGAGHVFDEKGAHAGCDIARIAVTPSADGATVAIEETTTGNTLDRGTLDRVGPTSAPVATSGPAAPATPDPAAAVAAIAGRWTGTLDLPAVISPDVFSKFAYQSDVPVTFNATVDLWQCAVGAGCGTLQRQVAVWPPTGQPFACTFDLTYSGVSSESAALLFDATPVPSEPKECGFPQVVVTPLTSGGAVAVEESTSGGGTFDHGVLARSSTSAAATPAPTPVLDAAVDPAALAAIAGRWTGTLARPTSGAAPGGPGDPSSGRNLDTTFTITGACEPNASCGSLVQSGISDGPVAPCEFEAIFRGSHGASTALAFDALPAGPAVSVCPNVRLVVTPLTSGTAVAVEEMVEGSTSTPYLGALTRSTTP